MKSGEKLKTRDISHSHFLTLYFVIGSFIILFLFIIYTNSILLNIRNEVKIVPDLYAKFISLPNDVNLEDFLLRYFMSEIIPNIDYPIILADSLKIPFSWENLEVAKIPFSQLSKKEQKFLLKQVKKMEKRKSIIPLEYGQEGEKIYSYVLFGESKTLKQLRMLPYLGMAVILLFSILGIYGLSTMRKSEKNLLWVGLAKETAHQFGTPISSLLGWIDILMTKIEEQGNNPEMLMMLNYMKADVDKLQLIASRFGKVGSVIHFQYYNLHYIIQETVDDFSRRMPSMAHKTVISFESHIEDKEIKIDPDLIKWTLENMIKNSIDAMQQKSGEIKIIAFEKNKHIHIRIKDEGSGIPKSMQKRIFYPGITSKKRGWGLGLSLAKRIIEEYHHGKIHVLESKIDEGTTFEIILPME